MNVSREEYDQVVVVSIDGELSADTVEAFKSTAQESLQEGRFLFVVNFEKVSLIDSEGLEALLWLKDQVQQDEGQVKLAALDEISATILTMTRLDHRFDIHPQVIQAVKCLS